MWHCVWFLFSLPYRYFLKFFPVRQCPEKESGRCDMASRGGATRPNGPNAGNKICQFKLVLLGESAVGKSSLVLRFVKGQFHEFQESTIGGKDTMWLLFNNHSCKIVLRDLYYWHALHFHFNHGETYNESHKWNEHWISRSLSYGYKPIAVTRVVFPWTLNWLTNVTIKSASAMLECSEY